MTTLKHRITDAAMAQHEGLVRQAQATNLGIEPDSIHPATWIVRTADEPGRIELTTRDRCTCRRFRLWHRCPCVVLVNVLTVDLGLERAA